METIRDSGLKGILTYLSELFLTALYECRLPIVRIFRSLRRWKRVHSHDVVGQITIKLPLKRRLLIFNKGCQKHLRANGKIMHALTNVARFKYWRASIHSGGFTEIWNPTTYSFKKVKGWKTWNKKITMTSRSTWSTMDLAIKSFKKRKLIRSMKWMGIFTSWVETN